jgi:hypothetical protein
LNPFSGFFKKLTPDPRTVDRALLAAEMAPSRARKAIGRAVSGTASTARRLGASARNAVGRLGASAIRKIGLHSDHLDHDKLVPVTQCMLSGYEKYYQGLVDKHYYYTSDGKFYISVHPEGPVGIWSDRSDIMTAQFLSGHEPNVGQTWAITPLIY